MPLDVERCWPSCARRAPSASMRVGQAADARRRRQRVERRQRRREAAVDEHQRVRGAVARAYGAQRVGADRRSAAPASNAVPAIGATLVNRHSSSRVVGKPALANRASAAARGCAQPRPARGVPRGRARRRRGIQSIGLRRRVSSSRALPPPRLRSSRSPSPRARAPAPCRPTARCGRRPARARSRARCSSSSRW